MANGPMTAQVQQMIQALLGGGNASTLAPVEPVPLAPTGGIGPLDFETSAALAALQPQPVAPALPGPVDAEAIRSRFAGLAGPEPVVPTVEPTSLVLRIARALQGFGAGVQGQGPQFLAGLREEAEAPQREFRARKERFDARKQELGVMAEQAVSTAEDRRMARTLELLDRQADRDFKAAARAAGVKDAQALERLRGAIDMERDAKKAEAERAERERKDAKDRESAVTTLANTFVDDFKISRQEARRFAEFELKGTPLSSADAKRYSKIEKYRPSTGGTGGTPGGKIMVEIANDDGTLSVVPFTGQISSAINAGALNQGPRGVFMEGQTPVRPSGVTGASPEGFPLAFGQPGAPIPDAPAPKPGTVFTRKQVEANARKNGRDPKAVEADILKMGGRVE